MIVCGFPGTGKSMMARRSNWVDLESTPFKKNWLLYAEVAKHMSDNGYTVMVSTHRELLEMLEQIETSYTVVVPPICDEEVYIRRYDMRGNSYEFIQTLRANWKNWLHDIITHSSVLRTVVILPKDGCIAAWAKDMRGEE